MHATPNWLLRSDSLGALPFYLSLDLLYVVYLCTSLMTNHISKNNVAFFMNSFTDTLAGRNQSRVWEDEEQKQCAHAKSTSTASAWWGTDKKEKRRIKVEIYWNVTVLGKSLKRPKVKAECKTALKCSTEELINDISVTRSVHFAFSWTSIVHLSFFSDGKWYNLCHRL